MLYFKAKEGKKKVVRWFDDLAEIFKLYHVSPVGGHSGWNATSGKISRVYTWKAMVEDIQKLTATCSQCQRYSRIKTVAQEMKPIKVKEPLELIGVDMIDYIVNSEYDNSLGPPWYSGTMRASGSEGSPSARVRILSMVRM
ncbi:hypothetical protein E2C01_063442 [Portunus trituberculatus]|uniref:Integrase zinc-binding domain-containing protein n=1 Tax=Portunus trituberculatus TaxID=210409 RepID=A0A5B7HKV2_PORTR|nr:hypothetical protein [Portunus trituberculatus]